MRFSHLDTVTPGFAPPHPEMTGTGLWHGYGSVPVLTASYKTFRKAIRHLPADLDKPLKDAAAEKIHEYRADYSTRPSNSISFMPAAVATTFGRLHCDCELVRM